MGRSYAALSWPKIKKWAWGLGLILVGLAYYVCLPQTLFTQGYSTVVFSENGNLLGARLSPDEQWRFPLAENLPAKVETALLQKEDQYFYYHPGFNPVALFRALYLNFKKGKVVSGGSTLSMQVVRLSRNNPPRTYLEKLLEIVRATRLELGYSKKEILALYATHAPFGGNIIGAETAAWRYFGRALSELSWAEAATLAVLPNAPGLINLGRNRKALKIKRNALLKKLWQAQKIDAATYKLALLETVPQAPKPLPQSALHLTQFLSKKQAGKRLHSTIDVNYQEQLQVLVNAHAGQMQKAKIYHAAALLIENSTGEVKAYVGNRNGGAGFYNNMLQTPRSSGSILKPFLYQAMLTSGELYPQQLVADVPVFLGDYQPKNFINSFDGAVPAHEALTRSLNIPAVLQLKDFGVDRFLKALRQQGFGTLRYSANHYGLSLILGGAEVTAWDLGKAYHRLAVQQIFEPDDSLPTVHLLKAHKKHGVNFLDKGASYTTLNVLTSLVRPSTEVGWQRFGQQKIAWKTGTSFGFRDAWAVGVSAKYTCVVWVGNASGEGRPGLVGATAAGPLLFRVLNALPTGKWFTAPLGEMQSRIICTKSGLPATEACPDTVSQFVPHAAQQPKPCTYHQKIYTDSLGYRVHKSCYTGTFQAQYPFILPPTMAWFYRLKNPSYTGLPAWRDGCSSGYSQSLALIYPKPNSAVFIPRNLDGAASKVILEAAPAQRQSRLFWHLNNQYLGSTETFHQMPVFLQAGVFNLLVQDEEGNEIREQFVVKSGVNEHKH